MDEFPENFRETKVDETYLMKTERAKIYQAVSNNESFTITFFTLDLAWELHELFPNTFQRLLLKHNVYSTVTAEFLREGSDITAATSFRIYRAPSS